MDCSLAEDQLFKFKEAFCLFDRDCDGDATDDSLGIIIRLLGQAATDDQLQGIIIQYDYSQTRATNYHEIVTVINCKMKDEKDSAKI